MIHDFRHRPAGVRCVGESGSEDIMQRYPKALQTREATEIYFKQVFFLISFPNPDVWNMLENWPLIPQRQSMCVPR